MDDMSAAPDSNALQRDDNRFDLFIVVLLGITATLTAFASWQDNLLGGDSLKDFSKATVVSDQASQVWSESDIISSTDQQQWLAYQLAIRDPERAGDADVIRDEIMRPELADAIVWFEDNRAQLELDSPFDEVEGNPYTIDAWEDAEELDDEAEQLQDNGEKLDAWGDKFGLVTVLYALALFLFGVAAVLDSRRQRLWVTSLGIAIAIAATIYVVTLGFYFQ